MGQETTLTFPLVPFEPSDVILYGVVAAFYVVAVLSGAFGPILAPVELLSATLVQGSLGLAFMVGCFYLPFCTKVDEIWILQALIFTIWATRMSYTADKTLVNRLHVQIVTALTYVCALLSTVACTYLIQKYNSNVTAFLFVFSLGYYASNLFSRGLVLSFLAAPDDEAVAKDESENETEEEEKEEEEEEEEEDGDEEESNSE